jgi:hypothetical protein
MTCLELGFKEYAKECGLPDKQAAHMFKRASAHPLFSEILKDSLSIKESEDLSFASELLKQDSVNRDIQEAFKKLKI